jgi:DnaJ like chaperone protein
MVRGMSLWSKISEIVSRLQIADSVGVLIDRLVETVRSLVAGTPESRQVTFTISMIALAAKMAKADGVVTADEVSIVRRLFEVPESERRNVARLFNLAKQDIAGFETYAARLRRLHDDDPAMLEDILDGLFIIAASDGHMHEDEDMFLERVAEIFGIDRAIYARVHARHVPLDAADPYVVLGIPRGSPPLVVKRAWRRLAADNHPDALIARGVPVECEKLANERMAAINAAYEAIERELVD